jgi:nitrogen fixation protein FixH
MTEVKKGRVWGIGMFALYGAFVCFVLGMVLFASMQRSELVEDHPYERGMNYQSRLDRIRNTAENECAVVIEHREADKTVIIRITDFDPQSTVSGEVRLLRPSNATFDRRWPLQLDSTGVQEIPVAGFASGLWRIEVDGKVDSVGCYYQTRVMLP